MTGIEFEEFHDDHADQVVDVINAAFAFDRTREWFEWKHREGPWGPSRGLVARDRRGIVGVRLLLPWRFRGPDGALLAYRAVEAATAPRAMGQGIFSHLNRQLMDLTEARNEGTFLFSTPNEKSRSGYRKLGWEWLESVPHVWRPVTPGRRVEIASHRDSLAPPYDTPHAQPPRIESDWEPRSLAWRLDARSGHSYEVSTAGTNDRAGLAYRLLVTKGARGLLPVFSWGDPRDRRRLLRAAARRERTLLVLDTGLPGGDPHWRVQGRRRGGSLITVWPTSHLSLKSWPVGDLSNWKLRFAELEGVL